MTRELAEKALWQWPVKRRSITLAAHRENAVFKVEADEGTYALRIHRPGYRTAAELRSELRMMAMLEGKGIAVPRPLASKDGSFLQQVDETHVSVLGWMAGRPLGQSGQPLQIEDRVGTFEALGKLIATVHDTFDRWRRPPDFRRQSWDEDGLLGEAPQWGRFWDNPLLNARQRDVMQQTRAKMRGAFAAGGFDKGLIHADMVCENILIDGATLSIIDFDDSGFGFRLQDLATALVKHEAEPDFDDLKAALLRGYAGRRVVQPQDVDLFLLMRHLSYVGWVVPRMANLGGEARARGYIANVMPMAERFLECDPLKWMPVKR